MTSSPGTPRIPPRILIVAENASARFGGEAILPLKYVALLARRGRDVRLITHARNRDALLQTYPDLAGRIQFSPDTAAHRVLWRLGASLPGAIRDHLFGNLMGLITSWQQRRMARVLVRAGKVDVVHQPIPVSPAAPSLLYGLGVPVIIGPMNGAMRYPPGYEDFEGRLSRRFVTLGRWMAGGVNRLIPGKRRAALLLVANPRTRAALPLRGRRVVEISENGVDLALWPDPGPRPAQDGPLRLVFMGRLVALKAVDLALRAMTQTRRAVTLEILGDGPERAGLEALVRDLGLEGRVTFHGFLPQTECARHLLQADALILPSLRECGGAVVLEAMAMRLATIVSDWGGPADYVDDTCGLRVAPSPRDSFPARLAAAIDTLDADPARTRALGDAGCGRVRSEYDWERKIDQIEALYAEVAGARA